MTYIGEWDCPRCGTEAILPVEVFLRFFGDPDDYNDPLRDDRLICIKNDDGTIYPVTDENEVYCPEIGGLMEMKFGEGEMIDARDNIKESPNDAACTRCYATFALDRFVR